MVEGLDDEDGCDEDRERRRNEKRRSHMHVLGISYYIAGLLASSPFLTAHFLLPTPTGSHLFGAAARALSLIPIPHSPSFLFSSLSHSKPPPLSSLP